MLLARMACLAILGSLAGLLSEKVHFWLCLTLRRNSERESWVGPAEGSFHFRLSG